MRQPLRWPVKGTTACATPLEIGCLGCKTQQGLGDDRLGIMLPVDNYNYCFRFMETIDNT
jgi:hypothetical protein